METKDLLEQLHGGVQAFRSTERWRMFLDTATRFHRYSYYNQLLIWLQRPDATYVAGYQRWRKELGQQVRKGERGISILAPLFAKRREETADGEERTREVLVGFRGVSVFDLAQTDPQDSDEARARRAALEEPMAKELTGADETGALGRLEGVARDAGLRVQRTDLGEMNGAAVQGGLILLHTGNAPSQDAKTLAHEIAHHWLDHLDRPEDVRALAAKAGADARALGEFEAESVAYIVSRALGLAPEGYSFGYLADWTAALDDAGLDALFAHCGARIQTTAKRLINAANAVQDAGLEQAA